MGKRISKVTVIMEIEVEKLDLFMNNVPSGVIEFSKETGANILKTTVSEGDKIREYKKQIDRKEKKLAKAKKLLKKWVYLFEPKLKDFPKPPIQIETEQFLKEKSNGKERT